jgi:nicotinamide-nucleotide adenylyltransferase
LKNLPALFIGRFQPFHLGHLDVIKQILRRHKKVIIGIGSAQYKNLPENPYSSALRKKMIEGSLRAAKIPRQKFTIVKIPDIHDDNRWVSHVEKLTPKFGTVYSGTPKVQKLFQKDGKYKMAKPKFNLRISGTEVRKRIKGRKRWQKLVPKEVRKLL